MVSQTPLIQIQEILQEHPQEDAALSALLPVLGEMLQCDRIFLYLRDPQTRLGKATHCWRRSDRFPEILDPDWKPEPENLEQEDPMFAAALQTAPSIFVEDVETASPQVVNRTFEQENFGHRALIHAHLCQDGQLWGVLQPCVFEHPRTWTEHDYLVMAKVVDSITPLAIAYVEAAQR